ncbi:hypothetical protein Dimus_012307 [Dionaea muscipula]
MAESEQMFSEYESEQHNFTGEYAPEHQSISGNEYELQNIGMIDSEQQSFAVNESEDQILGFIESEQTFPVIEAEQRQEENLSEQNLPGNELKQEFTENDNNEAVEAPQHLLPEEKQESEATAEFAAENKWPGWPGESVFRMLVPAQKVGNIIGRKGEYIKKIVEETRARIKILDGPPGTAERAVMVSAKEEPDSSMPPAIDGLLRVHKRIVDGLEGDSSQGLPAAGGKVSTRMLLPATQAGSLIGKQGSTVKSIQESSNCIVRVLGPEELPVFALQEDRVVEVVGEPVDVHKAIELVASHLRRFLVDRSVIPLFEMQGHRRGTGETPTSPPARLRWQMQAPNPHMEHHMPPPPAWGPPHRLPPNVVGGPGYGPGPQYMPPPRQMENYYPSADMPPPDRQPHPGIFNYGREPPMVHASSSAPPAPTMVTQVTHHMQIPLSYADAVIGAAGASISYIRRASGATVTIQETRGAPGEMTAEISGSASQVQTAQQLIQNFMADAAPPQIQPPGTADQGYNQAYNTYAASSQAYGSPPATTGYASQPGPGAYGSVYGGSYGY